MSADSEQNFHTNSAEDVGGKMVHRVPGFHQQEQLDHPEMVQEVVLSVQYVHQATGRLIHGLDRGKQQFILQLLLKR